MCMNTAGRICDIIRPRCVATQVYIYIPAASASDQRRDTDSLQTVTTTDLIHRVKILRVCTTHVDIWRVLNIMFSTPPRPPRLRWAKLTLHLRAPRRL